MKILTATSQTQGHRASDYNFCIDGELVTHATEICDRDLAEGPDGGCGCGRGFAGLNSTKFTTTAVVRDADGYTFEDLTVAVRSNRDHAGWGEGDEDDRAAQAVAAAEALAELAAGYPEGTVLERRLYDVQARDITAAAGEHAVSEPEHVGEPGTPKSGAELKAPAGDADAPLHVRTVGGITADNISVQVDHVYTMEADEDGHPEPGLVGLAVFKDDAEMSVLISPDDALVIANRLQRAANLVMEAGEDLPDPEREYRRHNASGGDGEEP